VNKPFWISIKENNFTFPEGYTADVITTELIANIGSTDPELRDTIGLEAFYHWLTQGLYSADDLRGIITQLLANLQHNIGEVGDDTVFLRSFSALWLVNIISYENKKTILTKDNIHTVLEAALAYFASERDLRGYVPGKGWVHALAHAADLLCALVISLHTNSDEHLKIFDCITNRLRTTTQSIFRYNEDSRIAQPLLWIFIRNTLTVSQIDAGLTSLSSDWNGAWQSEDCTRAYNNDRNLLHSLYWYALKKTDDELPNKATILELVQNKVDQARPWEW
jgi:hypothetical protein